MPEQTSVSWADRIKEAQSSQVSFEPVKEGYHNFVVDKAEVRTSAAGVDWINVHAKITDGEFKNARVFQGVFPNAKNVSFFLEFYKATGLSMDYLVEADPSTAEIASALQGRNFSAEVYVAEDARTDNRTNAPQRSLRGYKPQGADVESTPQTQPEAPAPAPAPQAPTQEQAPAAPTGSPWENATNSSGAPVKPW